MAKLGRFLVSPSVALLLLWMIVPLGMTLYFSLTPYDPINLPIVVWMVYTYFKDILEAAPWIAHTLAGDGPRSAADCQGRPGLHRVAVADPVLERGILVLSLTSLAVAPLTALIASNSSPEDLFWAKLSAVSSLACAPILNFGWISQKQLMRGLSFGAVK